MSESRVTLQDIAKEVGLTVAAVSMALRDHRRIPERTRERVRRAAAELGYRPDPLVSGLARYRRRATADAGAVIAVVETHRDTRPAELEPLRELATGMGYRLDRFRLVDYPSQRALARVLQARGIVGVLFRESEAGMVLEADVWKEFQAVYAGPYPGDGEVHAPVDVVRHNPFDGVVEAWRRARAAGARRIGLYLLTSDSGLTGLDRKVLGAYTVLQHEEKRGFPRLTPLIQFGRPSGEACREWVEKEKPEVVLGTMNRVYGTMRQAGFRIPEEIRFIALRKASERRDIAGLRVGVARVEAIALRHLDALIRQQIAPEPDHQTTLVLKPVWSPGESFGKEKGSNLEYNIDESYS